MGKYLYVHWLFVLLLVFGYINRGLENLLISYVIIGIHELSHLVAAKYIGLSCSHITVYPFGLNLKLKNTIIYSLADEIILYLAGPLSNIIVAFVSLLIYNICELLFVNGAGLNFIWFVAVFFYYIASINIGLAVFNLIPIPPLDGSRLLSALLPYKYYYALMRYERYIYFGLLALIWFGVLDGPLDYLSGALTDGLMTVAALPFKLLGFFG